MSSTYSIIIQLLHDPLPTIYPLLKILVFWVTEISSAF